MKQFALGILCLVASLACAHASGAPVENDLARRLDRLEAIKDIERLQSIYGYYQDRYLFDQPPTLFTKNAPAVHYNGGIWEGAKGVERLWLGYFRQTLAGGAKGPVAGQMFDQPQMQGVIEVSEDGLRATAMFRTLGHRAMYGKEEHWIAGTYRNDYVKEDGVWKFKTLRYCTRWSAPYHQGWQNVPAAELEEWRLYPRNAHGPDRLESEAQRCQASYPQRVEGELPFTHPVTGVRAAAKGASR